MKQLNAALIACASLSVTLSAQSELDISHYGEGGDTRAIVISLSGENRYDTGPLGDLNGDGFADLSWNGYIIFGRSESAGIQNPSGGAQHASKNITQIKGLGDVSGDGLSDLYVAEYTDHTFIQYVVQGSKSFTIPGRESGNARLQMLPPNDGAKGAIGTGDANGDGIGDFLAQALGETFNDFDMLFLNGKKAGGFPFSPSEGAYYAESENAVAPRCGISGEGDPARTHDDYSATFIPAGDIFGTGTDSLLTIHFVQHQVNVNLYEFCYTNQYLSGIIPSYRAEPITLQKLDGVIPERIAALGDMDGDGAADFETDVFAYPNHIISPSTFPSLSGAAGDLNGDGLCDPYWQSYPSSPFFVFVERPVRPGGGQQIGSGLIPIGDFNGDGYLDFYSDTARILLGSRAGFSKSGTYKSYAKNGVAPLRAVGEVPGGLIYPPDARAWLGFADGDGPSLQAVTLHRNLDGVSNIPPNMKAAGVHWSITSNRANYTQANLSLKYVDREISGLNEDCLYLLESSEGPAGPWFLVENATFEKDRDTVHFHTANLGDYLVAEYTPPGATPYTFNQSTENWTFAAPLRPDLATGDLDTTSGALEVAIAQGVNSFAFYESPLVAIENQSQPALYRMTYRAFTDQPDRLMNPQIRFRASLANFEQTQELVAPSVDILHGRDAFGPSLQGTDYEQYFLAPPNQSSLRMDFDVIATDPADAASAKLSLDSARLEEFPLTSLATVVLSYDFRSSNTNGFTLAAPHPTLTPAGFDASPTADGLSLRASATDSTSRLAFQFFGKTEGALRFQGDHLYRADFTIASHATAANSHALPGFRLRVNSESFQFATLLDVEPHAAAQPLPTEGAPVTYSLYFKAPAAIDGEQAIFSFDYLTTPEGQADSTAAIILQQLSVSEY
ncbi:hypothetical protein BH09SUM1_BH09SUM1_25160 [soil metagenome]